MIAPTLMAWASDEAKARYLPPLASGEEVWCQLFSSLPAVLIWPRCGPEPSATATTG